MTNRDELPLYPVATLLKLIGNKWKILIIREICCPELSVLKSYRGALDVRKNFDR